MLIGQGIQKFQGEVAPEDRAPAAGADRASAEQDFGEHEGVRRRWANFWELRTSILQQTRWIPVTGIVGSVWVVGSTKRMRAEHDIYIYIYRSMFIYLNLSPRVTKAFVYTGSLPKLILMTGIVFPWLPTGKWNRRNHDEGRTYFAPDEPY